MPKGHYPHILTPKRIEGRIRAAGTLMALRERECTPVKHAARGTFMMYCNYCHARVGPKIEKVRERTIDRRTKHTVTPARLRGYEKARLTVLMTRAVECTPAKHAARARERAYCNHCKKKIV